MGILVWLIAAGPGYWGYGASLFWTGSGNPGKRPLYDLVVQPGNKTIRRKSDQPISAQFLGFSAHQVRSARPLRRRDEMGIGFHAAGFGQ